MSEINLQPDQRQMLAHAEHLFGECLDGLVELAYIDKDTGRLSHAELFDVGDLDMFAARAAEINGVPGQNVYIGAALRKPGVSQTGRASDHDIFKLTALFADFDLPGAAEAAEQLTSNSLPTLIVTTGLSPHPRRQFWWKLDEPITDHDLIRHYLKALAVRLHGDRSVANPSRVMRLAGSIAWPVKKDRVEEVTTSRLTGRPPILLQSLENAFPRTADVAIASPVAGVSTLQLGAPGALPVLTALDSAKKNLNWHENMLRLTGRWARMGLSPEELDLLATDLTMPGYTVEQTRREVRQMVEGARRKFGLSDPSSLLEDLPVVQALRLLDWTGQKYRGEAPPIRWLIEEAFPLGVPVLLAAMGGTGKSFLALDLALHVALETHNLSFPKKIFGGEIAAHGTAVVLTAEDGFETVHRRFNKIDPKQTRLEVGDRLIVVPMPDAGGPRPLIELKDGVPAKTAFFAELHEQLLQLKDLRLVVIDPLQAFVMADVTSDPAAGQYMWTAFAELASSTGATILVTHHMRKEGMHKITSAEEARENIRGSTALVDGARAVYAMWRAEADRAQMYCETRSIEYVPGKVIQGAVVKANEEARYSMQTYLRGENGLLADATADYNEVDQAAYGMPDADTTAAILAEVDERSRDKERIFSAAPQSRRYLGKFLMAEYGVNRKTAAEAIDLWLAQGLLTSELIDTRNKTYGLFVGKKSLKRVAEVADYER